MGLLSLGQPLSWSASAPYREKVKHDGITQFLAAHAATAPRTNDVLKWGDEIEYTILTSAPDPANPTTTTTTPHPRTLRLSLRAPEIIAELERDEHLNIPGASVETLWRPEYANWMVEGTPGTPYRFFAGDLRLVEMNMRLRRREIEKLLDPEHELVVTMPAFPRLGAPGATWPPRPPLVGQYARSLYLPDTVTNPHPRFGTLTRNIRARRGAKVDIRVPLYEDDATPEAIPVLDVDAPEDLPRDNATPTCAEEDTAYDRPEDVVEAETRDIYMDCMAFGMGLSCLQVTLQARDIEEARYLYDQLAVLSPIFLSLTAATPAIRGYLADTDVRWDIISAACDDRTDEDKQHIPKSRYSSIDCFISNRPENDTERYNDIPLVINKEAYERLTAAGIDDRLATHVAHLFIRDPLVIFEENINLDNDQSTDHFENIQSTNWNTVRFKLPPPKSDIGWRTEFRPMEVQFTDFENAAFAIFVVLVSRVIVAFNLNLYMPMSKVDENMQTAHERDSVTEGLFHFRKNIFHRDGGRGAPETFVCSEGHVHHPKWAFSVDSFQHTPDPHATQKMSIDAIVNGTRLQGDENAEGYEFPGLLPLVRGYLDSLPNLEPEFRMQMNKYCELIRGRARGELWTGARWIRNFVETHPDYKNDSRVSESICNDLLSKIHAAGQGKGVIREMMGILQPKEPGCGDGVPDKDCIDLVRKKAFEDGRALPGQSVSESLVVETFKRIAASTNK